MWLTLLLGVAANDVTWSGYLMDVKCYNNMWTRAKVAPDNADPIRTPWDHTAWCMSEISVCRTYYLMENTCTAGSVANYRPKFELDGPSNAKALALMYELNDGKGKSDSPKDILVTVTGTCNPGGILSASSIVLCEGGRENCESCTGAGCATTRPMEEDECSVVPCTCTGDEQDDAPAVPESTIDELAANEIWLEDGKLSLAVEFQDVGERKMDSWVSLGFGTTGDAGKAMSSAGEGTDSIIFQPTLDLKDGEYAGVRDAVRRKWITGYFVDGSPGLTGGEDVEDAMCYKLDGVTTVTFSRALKPNSAKERAIAEDGSGNWLTWAYGAGALSYHDARGMKLVDLVSLAASDQANAERAGLTGDKALAGASGAEKEEEKEEEKKGDDDDDDGGGVGETEIKFDSNMAATYDLTDTDVTFTVTSKAGGWVGLGVSETNSMSNGGKGSDVVTCAGTTVERHQVMSNAMSEFDSGRAVAGASCSTVDGVTTMTFTRNLQAARRGRRLQSVELDIDPDSTTTLIWAYGSGAGLAYHAANRGGVEVSLASGKASVAAVEVSASMWVHVVLMVIAWGGLLPFGVLWAKTRRDDQRLLQGKPIWFAMHRNCQYTGWFLQLIAFLAIVVWVGENSAHFADPFVLHKLFGLIVVLFGTQQPLNAFIRPHPPKDGEQKAAMRQYWEYWHKGSGYFAVVVGPLNCISGIRVAKEKQYDDVANAATGLLVICLLPTVGLLVQYALGMSPKREKLQQ